MRRVWLTLAAGVALMLAAGAVALTRSPPRVVQERTGEALLTRLSGDAAICQESEALPAGVTGIRLQLSGFLGARVQVVAYSGSVVVAAGRRGAEWTSDSVTVPVAPLDHATAEVKLCVRIGPNSEPVYVYGSRTAAAEAATFLATASTPGAAPSEATLLPGRVGVEYLAAGRGSWWSRAASVATHMGLGRAFTGTWVAFLVMALVVACDVLAVWLTLGALRGTGRPLGSPREGHGARRTQLRRVPAGAWVCALIALLNAVAWSLLVPPFQGKDEVDHFAYVERLAETGNLPANALEKETYSPEQQLVMQGLHYYEVRFTPHRASIATNEEQLILAADVHAGAPLENGGGAGVAGTEPPLYYALQVVPYVAGRGNMLVQLQLMRLLGALFGALTALLVYCFLHEVLPGMPWAATVGAVCVALQPLLAFMSGSVNPDSLLYTVAAGVLLCLARAYRRGLTRRRAIVLGLLIAVGFLTKLNFIGLALGVFAGLVVLAAREARARGREAWGSLATAMGIGAAPVVLYVLRNALSGRPALGSAAGLSGAVEPSALFNELSYVWELYLPRLPGMAHYFEGMFTFKDIWLDRSVGLYGWMDTTFPTWVDNVALVPAGVVVLLCGRELWVRRAALRGRLGELGVYALIVLGVLVLVGLASYHTDAADHELAFGEPRYLLPLLPLLGAAIALAVRGAGRRWAPVAGVALVLLLVGHDLFSQLQAVARYYG